VNPFEKILGEIERTPSTFDLEAYKKKVREEDTSMAQPEIKENDAEHRLPKIL